MSEENQNPDTAAQPEQAAPEETFTLTRQQMDDFKARVLSEAVPAAAAAPAAPKMDPLAAYYAGSAGRAQQQAAKQQPSSPQGESPLDRVAKLMELQIMQTMAPKPPPPPKAMSVEEKLATRDAEIMLGRGPNGWTSADAEALRARHRAELIKSGFTGDVANEARVRASREVVAAFRGVSLKVSFGR